MLDANIGKVTLNKDAPSDVDKIIKEIKDIPLPIASREWLYNYMEDRGYSIGLRLWMGSNLIPDGHGKLKWGFNIQGADGEQQHTEHTLLSLATRSCKPLALPQSARSVAAHAIGPLLVKASQ